jgi:release factor glutamine methyltransferase
MQNGDMTQIRIPEPVTLDAALRWAAAELRAARSESPRLAAEVLLAHALGWERTRVLSHIPDPLERGLAERFQALVRRATAGEPLHYLTGEREFFGHSFFVTPDVLIPRPETEHLVERAIGLAHARAGELQVVDVGTGSGCIAVSVARALPRARVWATDISRGALAVARQNARRLDVVTQLDFLCCDLMSAIHAELRFDFILSNPPYIPSAEMPRLPRTVREYEPARALDGGERGLEVYRRLIPQATVHLAPGGFLLLEIGIGQELAVSELIRTFGLTLTETLHDLQSIPRCLVARR